MRRNTLWMTLVGGLFLAACGSNPTAGTGEVAPASAPTAVVAPTIAAVEATTAPTTAAAGDATSVPTSAASTDATAAPTTAAAEASAGAQTYAIVPDQSKVTYEVGETFLGDNRYAVAIGTTQQVSGTIAYDAANPQNSKVSTITIDISTFQTDSSRRDNAIRSRWLESATYPIAEFTPTQIEGLPTNYTAGNEITLQMTGDLKIRDVTKPTTFTVTGKIDNDTMTGVANTQIKMSDFGFQAPDIAGMLKAEDDVKITFEFVAKPE